jgi:hypothetical protein
VEQGDGGRQLSTRVGYAIVLPWPDYPHEIDTLELDAKFRPNGRWEYSLVGLTSLGKVRYLVMMDRKYFCRGRELPTLRRNHITYREAYRQETPNDRSHGSSLSMTARPLARIIHRS